MDRVVEARLEAVRLRIDQLSEQEQSLLSRLQQVREQLAAAEGERAQVEAAAQRVLTGGRRTVVAEATWRRAVRQLGTFTVSELATELGCSPITAKKHLTEMKDMGMVSPAGKLGRSPMYAYVKPEDAGAGFDAQQRLRITEDIGGPTRTYTGPVAGTGSHPADVIASTAVRKVVKDAIAQGWQLRPKGDGHFNLVKDGFKVGVAGTPKNPTGAAAVIARQVRNVSKLAA